MTLGPSRLAVYIRYPPPLPPSSPPLPPAAPPGASVNSKCGDGSMEKADSYRKHALPPPQPTPELRA